MRKGSRRTSTTRRIISDRSGKQTREVYRRKGETTEQFDRRVIRERSKMRKR